MSRGAKRRCDHEFVILNFMQYGQIPLWNETADLQAELERSDRTIAQAAMRPDMDPVERMVYNHQPANEPARSQFRDDLQKLVDWYASFDR
jgi:hypothetical protein